MLVIDDDVCLARAVVRTLKDYEVAVETDPTSGVARVAGADLDGDPFDVVLCDFRMPGMNGLEVLAAMRSQQEPPITILMSGDDDVADAARVADAVLLKPFRAREILDAIDRIQAQRARTVTRRMRPMSVATAEPSLHGRV